MAVQTKPEPSKLPAMITGNEQVRALIAPYLPPGVSLDRVAADVRLALAKDQTGALEKCTPASVFLAVAQIAKWGLSIGETAHLVPFGTTATPVADYKGLVEMVVASGVARHVEAHCVYEKEPFRIRRGTSTEITHEVIGDPKERGALIGAYALFHLRFGVVAVEYMAVSEIEEVRQGYSKQWKKGALPAWYAKKTAVRRGVKLLPKNPALLAKLAQFDEAEAGTIAADLRLAEEEGAPLVHRIGDGPHPLAAGGYDDAMARSGEPDDELPLDDQRPAARSQNAQLD